MGYTINHNSETITGATGFDTPEEFMEFAESQGVVTNNDILNEIKHKTRIGFTALALAISAVIGNSTSEHKVEKVEHDMTYGLIVSASMATQSTKVTKITEFIMNTLCDKWEEGGEIATIMILMLAES